MKRFTLLIGAVLFCAIALPGSAETTNPGYTGKGTVLLPNGWKLSPAGTHMQLDDLPMEMVESKDGRYLIITNNGYSPPVLSVVDRERSYVLDRVRVENAWLGLAFSPDGKKLYSSTGGGSSIQVFQFSNGKLKSETIFKVPQPIKESFIGGISVSPDGKRIYAVQILGNTLSALDSQTGKVIKTVTLDAEPYTSVLSDDGKKLFVSLWGGSRVLEFDAATLALRNSITVGEHPNALALSKDGTRLFVSCAHTNSVWVIDLENSKAEEQISVSLYPQAPVGSTPSGLGLSPDGKTLLVANSDNNCVAVVDVSRPREGAVKGFIPSGWYPTAAKYSQDGKQIHILSGKGLISTSNPRGPEEPNYIGQLLLGTLSTLSPSGCRTIGSLHKNGL